MDTMQTNHSPRDSDPSAILNFRGYRPLGIGDVLDVAVRLFRSRFVLFLGIVAAAQVPLLLAQGLLTYFSPARALPPGLDNTALPPVFQSVFRGLLSLSSGGVSSTVLSIVAFLIDFLRNATITLAASEVLMNRAMSVSQAYRRSLRYWFTITLCTLLEVFFIGLLCIPGILLGIIPIIGPLLAVIVIGVALFFFLPRWMISIPAIVAERVGPRKGLGRSWYLTGGRFWRVSGVWFFSSLLVFGISFAPTYLLFLIFVIVPDPKAAGLIYLTLSSILNIFFEPIAAIVAMVLYYDLRVRKEGFDIDMQSQAIQTEMALAAQPA